jgi:hypothetical protein
MTAERRLLHDYEARLLQVLDDLLGGDLPWTRRPDAPARGLGRRMAHPRGRAFCPPNAKARMTASSLGIAGVGSLGILTRTSTRH